jgi:hypothetical protein
MQFSPPSHHSIPLRSKYPPQHHIVKFSQVYVSPLMSRTRFHTHREPQATYLGLGTLFRMLQFGIEYIRERTFVNEFRGTGRTLKKEEPVQNAQCSLPHHEDRITRYTGDWDLMFQRRKQRMSNNRNHFQHGIWSAWFCLWLVGLEACRLCCSCDGPPKLLTRRSWTRWRSCGALSYNFPEVYRRYVLHRVTYINFVTYVKYQM